MSAERELREMLSEVNAKLDLLIGGREVVALMCLSEHSSRGFLLEEPDVYTVKDLKVRYK